MKTAGIIIIGDEILTGKVHDTNSFFLAQELRSRGIMLSRILVIPDIIDDIAREVRDFSARYDYVFTSGGIGPTHDDITIEGISKGFNVKPVIDGGLRRILEKKHKDLTPARLKMAEVPEGAELIEDGLTFPLIKFRNIYIFPGIPELLRKKFLAIADRFTGPKIFLKKVYLKESESLLAPYLCEILDREKTVKIGSYPVVDNQDYSVMVTFECADEIALDSAVQLLLQKVSKEKIVRVVP